jgi:biopolymer transport protein ExbD
MQNNQSKANRFDDDVEVNMTPMLDIVFIMLIFFIVTAVFVKESGVTVNRPNATTAAEVKRISTIIGVDADGEIWINKQVVQLEEVYPLVAKLRQENPKGKVVITADTLADATVVIRIIEQLNQLGITATSIATSSATITEV